MGMFKTYEYNKDDYRDKVMTEATKRPWGYVHHKGLDQHLVGATLENVAIVEDRHGNAKENSEFIVKAVNSHDALVAALATGAALIRRVLADGTNEIREYHVPQLEDFADELEAALEQVK